MGREEEVAVAAKGKIPLRIVWLLVTWNIVSHKTQQQTATGCATTNNNLDSVLNKTTTYHSLHTLDKKAAHPLCNIKQLYLTAECAGVARINSSEIRIASWSSEKDRRDILRRYRAVLFAVGCWCWLCTNMLRNTTTRLVFRPSSPTPPSCGLCLLTTTTNKAYSNNYNNAIYFGRKFYSTAGGDNIAKQGVHLLLLVLF